MFKQIQKYENVKKIIVFFNNIYYSYHTITKLFDRYSRNNFFFFIWLGYSDVISQNSYTY